MQRFLLTFLFNKKPIENVLLQPLHSHEVVNIEVIPQERYAGMESNEQTRF